MKIAIVSPYAIGQIYPDLEDNIRPVTWTENLTKALAKLDNTEVHIISGISPRYRNIKKYLEIDNIRFHFFPTSGRFSPYMFYLYEVLKIRKILSKIKPDIVHGQGLEGHSGLAAILSCYPNIVTIHGVLNEIYCEYYWDKFLLKRLERMALKTAKNIIAITPYATEVVKKYDRRGFANKKIFNIANPVAEQFFVNKVEKSREFINIIYSGVFFPRKGLLDLLKALKLLEMRNHKYNLYVIGIFDKHNKAQHYVNTVRKYVDSNISNKVEFLGFVDPSQIPALLRQMDMLVLPSKVESFSMAIAEAMAVGLPVVAYNADGPKYLIKDGETGFVVELNNINELADKIELLLTDKELRDRMGCKAREEARRQYHPDVVAKKTIDAYRNILNVHNMEMK